MQCWKRDARQLDHVNVVVAYVETHERVETEALAQGLETLRRKEIVSRPRCHGHLPREFS